MVALLPLSPVLSKAFTMPASADLLVVVICRMPKRTYAPSTLSFGFPVSTNIIVPTLKLSVRLLTTETSAAFSVSNGVLQLAVLSTKMSTFGRSAVIVGLARKMSVSSLTGSNTVQPSCGTAAIVAATTSLKVLAMLMAISLLG